MELQTIIEQLVVENTPKPPVEQGTYEATVCKIEARKNEKGTHWLSFMCELEDGRVIDVRYYFTEKTAGRSFNEIKRLAREFALKLNVQEFKSLNYLATLFAPILGLTIALNISVNGEYTNYVIGRCK